MGWCSSLDRAGRGVPSSRSERFRRRSFEGKGLARRCGFASFSQGFHLSSPHALLAGAAETPVLEPRERPVVAPDLRPDLEPSAAGQARPYGTGRLPRPLPGGDGPGVRSRPGGFRRALGYGAVQVPREAGRPHGSRTVVPSGRGVPGRPGRGASASHAVMASQRTLRSGGRGEGRGDGRLGTEYVLIMVGCPFVASGGCGG